jgi:hypothetical protein
MYFANVQYIHNRLRKYVARAGQYSEAAGMLLFSIMFELIITPYLWHLVYSCLGVCRCCQALRRAVWMPLCTLPMCSTSITGCTHGD